MNLRKHQRGYAVIPYLASFFTTAGAAGAAGGTAAVGAGAAGIGASAAGAALAAGATVLAAKASAPKPLSIAGNAPPSIDQAKQAQQDTDRLRLRRGVLSNIYGGGATGGGTPQVASKTLLGQ